MINILYSILVAGSRDIPESFHMYRRHSKISYIHPGILDSDDPFRKSIYANYVISLSKLSVLYDKIIEIDKSNTYRIDAPIHKPYMHMDNCIVLRQSNVLPVVSCTFDATSSGVIGVYNGIDFIAEYTGDQSFQLHDMTIKVMDTTKPGSLDMYMPSIGLVVPDRLSASKYISDLPDNLINDVDLSTPVDCAGTICLSALKRFTKDVII